MLQAPIEQPPRSRVLDADALARRAVRSRARGRRTDQARATECRAGACGCGARAPGRRVRRGRHAAGEGRHERPDRAVHRHTAVDAAQLPSDALEDMRRLLAAAGVKPPYVLLGASFGGLPAYLYANTHPRDVVGMVLLDAAFPDELSLERLFEPRGQAQGDVRPGRGPQPRADQPVQGLRGRTALLGHEPPIPVTYLSSIPEGFDVNDLGVPEYNDRILGLQAAYVRRFSPGRYLRVQAPHFMEVVLADKIARELRRVIASAGAHPIGPS